MINNKGMKNLFIILSLLILFSGSAFAVPDTIQKGVPTFTYWDNSYNVALHKKLVADYDKKYLKYDKTNDVWNYDLRNYEKEVTIPYYKNAKNWQDTIIKK